ncbi:hypothetical protein NESM_000885800 [Novymonas esmeraldas]|uniref:Uncharacterized protein n=1 Tax=Novymonas esmeraldas TaxID=1808958 RepID=A0AAW0F1J1_9TRYP
MYNAVRDIEALSRTHLPLREGMYRPIEERQKILALMEGRVLAQVLSFMKPHRHLTMCAVSPTARVCAELVQVSSTRAPCKTCLGDRLVHKLSGRMAGDYAAERLIRNSWWLVRCGLPLHLDNSNTWTVLRVTAPALVPMVRSSPLSAAGEPPELQVSDILQLEEMCIRGDSSICIANVTPSQLTRLRRLAVDDYTAEHCEYFLLQLPGLTELSTHSTHRKPVSLMEPAYAARLQRLSVHNPTMNTFSWICKCASVTHLSIIRCSFAFDVESFVQLPYLTSLDMTGSNVMDLDGLCRCLSLRHICVKGCLRLLSIAGLAGAPQLQSIDASRSGVETIGELHRCPLLTRVDFKRCVDMASLAGLAGAPQLHSIDASETGIETLGELHRCPLLSSVKFEACPNLDTLAGLAGAPRLQTIDATGIGARTLGELHRCPLLTSVDVQCCSDLDSLAGLAGAPQLLSIDASLSGIQTLGELHRCPLLTSVDVEGCKSLHSLAGLAGAPQLQSIKTSGSGVPTAD